MRGESSYRSMKNVTAAILAGGLGTRLQPLISGVPKVLARVHGRPFVAFLLDQLESAGIRNVIMLTGHHADQVSGTLGLRHGAMKLKYSIESSALGTAGALAHALPMIDTRSVLLLNGDSYCDVNLRQLVSEHVRCRAEGTITLAPVADAGRFGRVELEANGRVTRFAEKQQCSEPGWINAGVYLLEKALIQEIPQGRAVSLEREMVPTWLENRALFGFRSEGRFLDIGTPESYSEAAAFFAPASRGQTLDNGLSTAGA